MDVHKIGPNVLFKIGPTYYSNKWGEAPTYYSKKMGGLPYILFKKMGDVLFKLSLI